MKDLEKIKSDEVAAQVQDANPANFAIEQEVAQLVGATVPQPTQPSADDARELGAQLLVFLRRALLPIRSALRTAVAAIYAHLDSRCTDYTPAAYDPFRLPAGPYDPMRPFVARTLPNLLQALTAFAPRKISNGSAPSDGIPDGTSLARLLCASDSSVTKIIDDTYDWTLNKQFPIGNFPSLQRLVLNCKALNTIVFGATSQSIVVELPYCETLADNCFYTSGTSSPNVEVHCGVTTLPMLSGYANYSVPYFRAGRVYFDKLKKGSIKNGGDGTNKNTVTTYVYVGCYGEGNADKISFWGSTSTLTDLEIREGARQAIDLSYLTTSCALPGLTAENIVNHIFEKLADNSEYPTITLNLTSDLLNKLTDEQKAIAQNKNYTLA